MYVSRPVRAIRDDPVAGGSIRVLVTIADERDSDQVRQDVRDVTSTHGGAMLEELAFDTVAIEIQHEGVDALCAVDGIEAIETEDTISMSLDGAGEDVSYDE
jgi:hypothetical protein